MPQFTLADLRQIISSRVPIPDAKQNSWKVYISQDASYLADNFMFFELYPTVLKQSSCLFRLVNMVDQ